MYNCLNIYICVYIDIYVSMYIYMHTHIYMYICIYKLCATVYLHIFAYLPYALFYIIKQVSTLRN